jgi:hypothetical protein
MGVYKYCFIFRDEGLSSETCNGSFASETFEVNVFGVDDRNEAIGIAKDAVAKGTKLIELCGDFDQNNADKIKSATENKADVRFVTFDPDEFKKFDDMESEENYGFIIMADGFNPEKDHLELADNSVKIIGVSTIEQACEKAKEIVDGGIDSIELCSAFDGEKASKVIAAIAGRVPVGYAKK